MKIFTKKYFILGLCLTLALAFFLNPILAVKPDKPSNPNKPDKPEPSPELPTLIEQIEAELDYIVYSSWTEENLNSKRWGFLNSSVDIYGALNSNRIPSQGIPSRWAWVKPGIAGMTAVGMMKGVEYLDSQAEDITKYDAVLDKFFLSWVKEHNQGQNRIIGDPDFGAFADRVYYDNSGNVFNNDIWKTDVTAQMMIAMRKYYEYKVAIGQSAEAEAWLTSGWIIMKDATDYLVKMYDTTPANKVKLLPGNSSENEFTTWIHFAANAVPALRSASRCADMNGASDSNYLRVANDLVSGIELMEDADGYGLYFRYIPYENGSYGYPTYGDDIDQLTFVPIETGAIVNDSFAQGVSDWWTDNMTYQISDETNWRYWGTHWHRYSDNRPENEYLYAGPGFQLAKAEWKSGRTDRSFSRLEWGRSLNYSSLWWFMTGEKEVKVPNGFLDWRNSQNYSQVSEDWARFTDTSAYFIEALLMNEVEIDTDYNPITPQINK
ncbi:hypothetical protein KAI92_02195 [Candidatus Parcubacteria bacterium]|nr:hypothetical protein [Candidatus Parcubacteria bacterium]